MKEDMKGERRGDKEREQRRDKKHINTWFLFGNRLFL